VQFELVADLAVGLVVGLGGVGERRAIRRRSLGTASPAALVTREVTPDHLPSLRFSPFTE